MSYTKPIGVAYEDQDLDDAIIGKAPTLGGKVGFYGKTPVVQRAASIQAASIVSATSVMSAAAKVAEFAAEVAATLTALGLWKGSA